MLDIISLIGVGVFAISGALAAGRKGLDLVGVLVIAAATAIGGGTMRDVLLGRYPLFWIADPRFMIVIIVSALLTVLYVRHFRPPNKLLFVADGVGLALFSIMGAQIAEQEGLAALIVVLLGVMTGVAGGVVRDVLSAELPMILQRGHLYATAAAAGIAAYLLLQLAGVPRGVASAIGMLVIAALRYGSIFLGLKLPVFSLAERDES